MLTPLEIHHINVSQGDSTLIILRDLATLQRLINTAGYQSPNQEEWLPIAIANGVPLTGSICSAILIDGGNDEFCGDIKAYLSAQGLNGGITANRNFFSVVLTHRHADHMDGIRGIYWNASADDALRTVTSPTGTVLNFNPDFPPGNVYDDGGAPQGGVSGSGSDGTYEGDIACLSTANHTVRNTIAPGNTISMGTYTTPNGAIVPINLRCVYANGNMLMDTAGNTQCPPNLTSHFAGHRVDQNSLSVCLVVEFGQFRYFIGGDIGGNGGEDGGNQGICSYTPSTVFSIHPDVESSLKMALRDIYPYTPGTPHLWDGHMCGFKANHHGSGSSNDIHFLSTLTPVMAVISSGIRTDFHKHPTQEVLNRIDCKVSGTWDYIDTAQNVTKVTNSIKGYYITEMAATYKNITLDRSFPSGNILGDIIVRPDAVSIDTPGVPVPIQVYGTGEQSGPLNTRTIHPCCAVRNTPPYPIGPFLHQCTNH